MCESIAKEYEPGHHSDEEASSKQERNKQNKNPWKGKKEEESEEISKNKKTYQREENEIPFDSPEWTKYIEEIRVPQID